MLESRGIVPAAARRARAGPCFHMLRTPPRSPTSFLLRAPAPFRDYLRSVRPSSSTCSATACTPSTSSACLPTAVIRRVRSSRGGRGRELGLLRSGQYVAATALSCPRGACCNAHERKRMRRRKKQSKLPRCCVPPQKCHGFVETETMQEEFSEHDTGAHNYGFELDPGRGG
ncbi:uncharacterized protein LOC119355679 isoform X2 [Triticum dicoccoides]|uniref:uncharacterized protein LOC119355679 isoform X2 n=1 Tax=Triticum dicoccoides TaxID=85692 RepID=UPI00188F3162|nr:uncharacterized protein LOC119355679 isoform X2 [Triticum dicoccoides]